MVLTNSSYVVDIISEGQVIEQTMVCPNCGHLMMPINMKKTNHYCLGCGSLFHSN